MWLIGRKNAIISLKSSLTALAVLQHEYVLKLMVIKMEKLGGGGEEIDKRDLRLGDMLSHV